MLNIGHIRHRWVAVRDLGVLSIVAFSQFIVFG
jgi:hypothetical protein